MTETRSVGLLVTCLVDLFRPEVAFAALSLLRAQGLRVEVPRGQTCCGQVAHNSGDRQGAREVAAKLIPLFEPYDYLVAPSGSCAGQIRHQFPVLFPLGDPLHQRATALAAKSWELLSFLHDVVGMKVSDHTYNRSVTYHDSCSSRREMGVVDQPRALLGQLEGLALRECDDLESCCGFGGTFCVKYPSISTRMADERIRSFEASGAEVLVGGDLGCLLHLAGRLARRDARLEVRHVAELLAGMTDQVPPIGQGERAHE